MKKTYNMYYAVHPSVGEELGPSGTKVVREGLEESTRKSSCWFSSLPLFGNGARSLLEYWRGVHLAISKDTGATAKVCPAIHSVLDNGLLVKAPCELAITIDHTGEYTYTSSSPELMSISDHPVAQFGGNIAPFKNKLALKFNSSLVISSGGAFPYIFLHPHFHNNVPFLVINGVVPTKYSEGWSNLNTIVLFDVPSVEEGSTTHLIRRGTVLAYLWADKELILKDVPYTSRSKKVLPGFLGEVV